MLKSHSIVFSDFKSDWYKAWAKKLKQTTAGRGKFALRANKFWQNAVMAQALYERGALQKGNTGIGFGVGKERLPALFASMDVKVTATDQDFTKAKAKQWNNDQLAQGAFSLNEDAICPPDLFEKNMDYMPLDMNKIQRSVHGKYDFLWSNCALGHLGSIEKGHGFIEASLQCLKPGGWAVHTTEVNVMSNEETVSSGPTVIFRLKDIHELCQRLTKQGFICSPFILSNGQAKQDRNVSLNPAWGTDSTKILVGNHLATQIVLIIQRPGKTPTRYKKTAEKFKHRQAYRKNLRTLQGLNKTNPHLKALRSTQSHGPLDYNIVPLNRHTKLSGSKNEVVIQYRNDSPFALAGLSSIFNARPLVLGTDSPVNHDSPLASSYWHSSNRPGVQLHKKTLSGWQEVDYVNPGAVFSYVFSIERPKGFKPQTERFSLILEGSGVVPNTQVSVTVK